MSKKSKNNFQKLLVSLLVIVFLFVYTTYLEDPINNLLNSTGTDKTQSVMKREDVSGDLKVYFVDVGQGDCILITNKDKNMLIDAGNNEDGAKLVTYFQSLGIEEFDYVVGTHAHEDHIGGLDNIINEFKIDTFYMPDVATTTKTFEDVVTALENKSLAFETPEIGDTFKLEDASFKVLYVGNDGKDLNNTSIVLKMTYGSNSFLFTGDATSTVEKKILDQDLKSDVLKVGHHGSQYSSTNAFLKAVDPKYAVIQVGKNNTYKHPRQETLDKLSKLNVKVYRTDTDGTVIATTDGSKISFTTMETDTNG